MVNLSQTRWIALSGSMDLVQRILSLLQKITDKLLDCDKNTPDQAKAILKKMKKSDFIFSLATLRFVMRRCKVLVGQVHEESLNSLDALGLVSSKLKR